MFDSIEEIWFWIFSCFFSHIHS